MVDLFPLRSVTSTKSRALGARIYSSLSSFFQDTVVALQALVLYSEKTAGNALNLRVTLTSEMDGEWKPPEIHITPENALLRRREDVRIYNSINDLVPKKKKEAKFLRKV